MAGANELFYDTTKLGELGDSFSENGAQLETIHDDIVAIVGKISENWSGEAYNAFKIVVDGFISSIEEVVPLIKGDLGAKFLALKAEGEDTTRKNTALFQ